MKTTAPAIAAALALVAFALPAIAAGPTSQTSVVSSGMAVDSAGVVTWPTNDLSLAPGQDLLAPIQYSYTSNAVNETNGTWSMTGFGTAGHNGTYTNDAGGYGGTNSFVLTNTFRLGFTNGAWRLGDLTLGVTNYTAAITNFAATFANWTTNAGAAPGGTSTWNYVVTTNIVATSLVDGVDVGSLLGFDATNLSPVFVGAPTLGGHAVNKTYGDATYTAIGGPGTSTNLSDYNNDAGFITNAAPGTSTNLSDYNNDSGFLVTGGVGASTNLSDYNNDAGFITNAAPGTSTNLSDYNNDSGFLTNETQSLQDAADNGGTVAGVALAFDAANASANTYGGSTVTLGPRVIQGAFNTAAGTGAHAEGTGTAANGDYSRSGGIFSVADGDYSEAIGASTRAGGNSSVAQGNATTNTATASHSEGWITLASGAGAHSEGYMTTASGNHSHAQGSNSTASGHGSWAGGANASATNKDSFVWSGGAARSSTAASQFTVDASGGVRLLGSPTEGLDATATNHFVTKAQLDTATNGLLSAETDGIAETLDNGSDAGGRDMSGVDVMTYYAGGTNVLNLNNLFDDAGTNWTAAPTITYTNSLASIVTNAPGSVTLSYTNAGLAIEVGRMYTIEVEYTNTSAPDSVRVGVGGVLSSPLSIGRSTNSITALTTGALQAVALDTSGGMAVHIDELSLRDDEAAETWSSAAIRETKKTDAFLAYGAERIGTVTSSSTNWVQVTTASNTVLVTGHHAVTAVILHSLDTNSRTTEFRITRNGSSILASDYVLNVTSGADTKNQIREVTIMDEVDLVFGEVVRIEFRHVGGTGISTVHRAKLRLQNTRKP